MPINILMPALSPTMTEGKLARWLKASGDHIGPGDVIAEIETDKATMEVEAVDEGRLADIRVAAGTENVPINTVIAVMLAEGETDSDLAKPDVVPPVKATASPVPEEQQQKPQLPPAKPVVAAAPSSGRIIASPLARRIAAQQGIDLSTLKGTGPNGRIVRADLDGAKAAPQSASAPRPAPQPGKAAIEGKHLADLLGMAYQAQPNSTVRKTIARRLTEAKQQVPHFYLTVDCDIEFLNQLRIRVNARGDGTKLSVNDFVIKAAALALRQVPAANASWTDNDILLFDHADISVAVATDNGLITPIIKAAETKGLAEISREMKDLGTRARAGKLKPEEFQGGTFSISNLGMYGIREFAAIINPPQACILAVGAGEQRAVVRDGQLAIATMMTCTLSVDHRAVDGAVGAEYLAAFKKVIEDPLGLLTNV
jgi:pyruvate dehydrogenase E2 component (dihydrolipoamide acetyltransferase)